MNEFIIWLITIASFLLGVLFGRFQRPENEVWGVFKDASKRIQEVKFDKPKPGVVQHLTPEEIEEKHDPTKKGNLEAFNSLFADETGTRIQEVSKKLGTTDPRQIADYLKKELK